MVDNDLMMIDEKSLKDRIYTIRGQQVMLDFDLAEIYGYETNAFNQQVKRNKMKFDDDFMFHLTKTEWDNLMSQNVMSSWGGRRKLPNAFTEQGIYMLMTILHGELATQQSKNLIRLFKQMKNYIVENQQLMITKKELDSLADSIENNTRDIRELKQRMDRFISQDDLPAFMKLFDHDVKSEEVLILDGEPFKADVAYREIYRRARRSILVIDDYIGLKTLQHLVYARSNVKLTIVSDNKLNLLKLSEYKDFLTEYPIRTISFLKSQNRVHDRYIILDQGTTGMKVYHCGASSKDAGRRITTITRVMGIGPYKQIVKDLLANPPLILK